MNEPACSWDLWAEFCNTTGRETRWGAAIGEELRVRGIFPCASALDVGCGTGEFTQALLASTPRVEGLDVLDLRSCRGFPFHQMRLQDYEGSEPDVVLFKQSFHLLEDFDSLGLRFPRSTLVLAQMPRPTWASQEEWSRRPLDARLNAEALRQERRPVDIVRLEQSYRIDMQLLERMFLEGYTSDLRKLSLQERMRIWEDQKPAFAAGAPFADTLDLVIAHPIGR